MVGRLFPVSGIDKDVEADMQRAAPGDFYPGQEAAVIWCDVVHGHAGGTDETVLGICAVFADVDEDARVRFYVGVDEVHRVDHAVCGPRVIRGKGRGAQVSACGTACAFRVFAFLFQRLLVDFLLLVATLVFYFHFHDVLLIDSVDAAQIVRDGTPYRNGDGWCRVPADKEAACAICKESHSRRVLRRIGADAWRKTVCICACANMLQAARDAISGWLFLSLWQAQASGKWHNRQAFP